jgi:hypothetical protein
VFVPRFARPQHGKTFSRNRLNNFLKALPSKAFKKLFTTPKGIEKQDAFSLTFDGSGCLMITTQCIQQVHGAVY